MRYWYLPADTSPELWMTLQMRRSGGAGAGIPWTLHATGERWTRWRTWQPAERFMFAETITVDLIDAPPECADTVLLRLMSTSTMNSARVRQRVLVDAATLVAIRLADDVRLAVAFDA